jgi:Holliday junction resolvase RusA-like endonuclease
MSDHIHKAQLAVEEIFPEHKGKSPIVFEVEPMGAPRMTQRDRWAKRPVVVRYFTARDHIKLLANLIKFEVPESHSHVIFFIPMSQSWSKKKKEDLLYKPHRLRPDKDNLEKFYNDALAKEDCYIWDGRESKLWSEIGMVMVYSML